MPAAGHAGMQRFKFLHAPVAKFNFAGRRCLSGQRRKISRSKILVSAISYFYISDVRIHHYAVVRFINVLSLLLSYCLVAI